MSNQKIIRVNDKAYMINAFKGLTGWSYLPRLTKYVFPFIGYMLNEGKGDEEVVEQLMGLLTGENAKDIETLIIEMVADIQVDNMRIDFDKEFSQNYDSLILLFLEVIKLNYLESFQRLVTNLPKQ